MEKAFYSLTSIGSKDTDTQAKILIQKMEEMRLEVATARGKLLANRIDIVLHEIALASGVPMYEWDLDQWEAKCSKGLLCGQTGHGTGSSSISVSLP